MIGLFLVGLLIVVGKALAPYWPLLAGAAGLFVLWRWMVLPIAQAHAAEVRDQRRHERARQEIDRIALQSRREMYDAAIRHADVIEGTAREIEPR